MDNENDITCDCCDSEVATVSEQIEGEDTDICDTCFAQLPTDEWTGELVREIHDTVNGYDISYNTYVNINVRLVRRQSIQRPTH